MYIYVAIRTPWPQDFASASLRLIHLISFQQSGISTRRVGHGRNTIQHLAKLFKVPHHILALTADQPLRKRLCHLRIRCLLPNKQMRRVQKQIVRPIRPSLVNRRFIPQRSIQREDRAPICDGIFLQEDGSGEGLDGERNVLVVPCCVRSSPWNLFALFSNNSVCQFRGQLQSHTCPIPAHKRLSLIFVADLS